ncbi:hypothetical protein A2U01_0089651, partial [Trifolium medium]|nr:hypothetical protein [Trifolium medium]
RPETRTYVDMANTELVKRTTLTLRCGGGQSESGKKQSRHQPPSKLDAAPPHDPCGP